MVIGGVTKPKPPMVLAPRAPNLVEIGRALVTLHLVFLVAVVRNGKLTLGSISPALYEHYQPLPAGSIKYTYMKTAFKTLAISIALSSACLLLHYLIGSMSY